MIGRLTGNIIDKKPPLLVIDINGIGYEVLAPMSTFYQLPDINETVSLFTHLIVREDQHSLYGFATDNERQLFRTLIKVNGVGPKLALTILTSIEADQFVNSINNNDASSLVRIPGIGKKTAERLIIEMRDKFSQWQTPQQDNDNTIDSNRAMHDAISALNSLGYKPNEARKAVEAIHHHEHTSEQLIRLALQQIAKG